MALPKVYRAANESLNNPIAPGSYVPGSRELKNRVHERYARYRAQCLPRVEALREAARTSLRHRKLEYSENNISHYVYELEAKPQIAQRIQYLANDETQTLRSKRNRLEERLWSFHEADIGNYIETVTINGKVKQRPKLLSDIDPEHRKNIEKIAINGNGEIVPILHSSLEANKELRKLLDIGRRDELASARLSDAELIAQLSEQANQLGVKVDLSYSFDGAPSEVETDGSEAQTIDNTELDDDKR